MPHILGMSIGAWIVLIAIIAWAVIAIKVYFFGGFKKKKGQKVSIGACCGTGDENCAACAGCNEPATKRNAVTPIVKDAPAASNTAK